jgi:hypothetical protein
MVSQAVHFDERPTDSSTRDRSHRPMIMAWPVVEFDGVLYGPHQSTP